MQITLLTIGSRGDVQPYVALALGLQRAGHLVTVGTHQEFEAFIRQYGLAFAPVAGNPREIVHSPAGQAWLAAGNNPLTFWGRLRALAEPLARAVMADCLAACRGADLIVAAPLAFLAAYHIADKTGQRLVTAPVQPLHPTRAYPNPLWPPWPLGPVYNALSYRLTLWAMSWVGGGPANHIRQHMVALPPERGLGILDRAFERHPHAVYGYSRHVVPQPADWPATAHVAGYWFLEPPAGWTPPPALVRFLEAGPPPVYVGFGSLVRRDPRALTRLVLGALQQTGHRAILLGGWGGLHADDLPHTVHYVDAVPHDWLFPQMRAIVHHGGAGTTAAALRAGVPTVLTPIFSDQPFWAWRVATLGAGPRGLPQDRLTAASLAAALDRAVHDPALRQRAAALGERIRAEDGVGAAVAWLSGLGETNNR